MAPPSPNDPSSQTVSSSSAVLDDAVLTKQFLTLKYHIWQDIEDFTEYRKCPENAVAPFHASTPANADKKADSEEINIPFDAMSHQGVLHVNDKPTASSPMSKPELDEPANDKRGANETEETEASKGKPDETGPAGETEEDAHGAAAKPAAELPNTLTARYLLCKCYGSKYWSLTARVTQTEQIKDKPIKEGGAHCALQEYKPYAKRTTKTKYVSPKAGIPDIRFPIPQRAMWEVLYGQIPGLKEEQHPHGIIVVTGSTGTGKSTIVRGLIHTYLQHRLDEFVKAPGLDKAGKKRRPHFLTVEDPIETLYYDDPDTAQTNGLDYTPREIGKDTTGIRQVFQDALRQTPSIVYVGEVRQLEDWQTIVDFAGTGHLVITTAHAGSLAESMDRILKATNADTPVRRGQVAQALMAVIHLQNVSLERHAPEIAPDIKQHDITLPALWRRTSKSVAALVADGLASVLPGRDAQSGSIGRLWFAQKLSEYAACYLHPSDIKWEEVKKAGADKKFKDANDFNTRIWQDAHCSDNGAPKLLTLSSHLRASRKKLEEEYPTLIAPPLENSKVESSKAESPGSFAGDSDARSGSIPERKGNIEDYPQLRCKALQLDLEGK